jgi:enediyne biosynthesis protein E4
MPPRIITRFLTISLLHCVAVSGAVEIASPVFRNVAESAGLAFQPTFGDGDMSSIIEATGFGCAFIDYDSDGLLDIYFVNGRYLPGISDACDDCPSKYATNVLYRNEGDGTFADVTLVAGVGDTSFGMGVAAADFDNDGDTDLYVTNYGRNTYYRNDGGVFADATTFAGVGDTLWSIGATALDYDNDGLLDLYVANYLEFDPEYRLYYAADEFPGPLAYPGQQDRLYRNNGDGTFRDVSVSAGLVSEGRGMGTVAADYDGDGWVDIFVANDAMENYLWCNNGDGTFTNTALLQGVAYSESGNATSSMGGDFGDVDGDGDLDILVPDMGYKSLYLRENDLYRDAAFATKLALISGQYVSWGGAFLDYDLDSRLDIFLANGDAHRLASQEDVLLRNVTAPGAALQFADAWESAGSYFRTKAVGRGSAVADYDNDGDLDIAVLNLDQHASLLRNDRESVDGKHWLMIALEGTRSNRDGVGAHVTLEAGGRTQVRTRMVGNNYLSIGDPRLHFGLGEIEHVDSLTVRWPSGTVQVLTDLSIDTVVRVREPAE